MKGESGQNLALEPVYFIVRLDNDSTKRLLKDHPWQMVRRLDHFNAIYRKPPGVSWDEPALGQIIAPVNDEWKLSSNLNFQEANGVAKDFVIKSWDVALTQSFLDHKGVSSRHWGDEILLVRGLLSGMAQELISRSEVIYLGAESQQPVEDSRVLDMNLNPNKVNLVHHHFPELKGQGLVLSVKESGYRVEDVDLVGRHLNSALAAPTTSNHATEMATIAAGAGNSSLYGLGVAGQVTLTSSLLSALFPDQDREYQELEVSVQNHSYGTEDVENFYGAAAEAYDQSANVNPNLLHVFSIGNLGESAPESGAYAGLTGFANLSGNFKASKNSLSVASVDTVGRKVAFVSSGPAHDGRIKPELSAYSVFGSSNSAALVSGVAVVLQQAYRQVHGTLPPSALVKALLINGARDVGATGPDYQTGYGNVDAYRSLQDLLAGNFASGELTQDEEDELTINIPPGTTRLKVSLVWNDPAATANSNLALVNDLDLVLEDAGNQEWMPWVLDPAADRLLAEATRTQDRLNNVEQVSLDNPAPGPLTLKIRGHNVPDGPQRYFVTWTLEETEQFQWNFPSASDNMPFNGETTGYFRWESSLSAGTGQLEYSTDGGDSWELIDAEVSLASGHYRWESPDLKTAAMARMRAGGQLFETGTFTISRPDRVEVGYSCADSVRIQWASIPGATYEVLSLGNTLMEQVAATTDTAFSFNKSDFDTRFFAIQPVLADGTRPLRSVTFDYDFQGVGCYLIAFSTELDPDQGVFLNLDLGTTAGIREISFERASEPGVFAELMSIPGVGMGTNIRLLDSDPNQGLNNYRVRLLFENGEELISEVSSAYFLTTNPFLVFPNPLPRGESLKVFSRQFEEGQRVTFSLFDPAGNKAFDLALNTDRFAFDLNHLPAGMYIYRITTAGLSRTGRLILN